MDGISTEENFTQWCGDVVRVSHQERDPPKHNIKTLKYSILARMECQEDVRSENRYKVVGKW